MYIGVEAYLCKGFSRNLCVNVILVCITIVKSIEFRVSHLCHKLSFINLIHVCVHKVIVFMKNRTCKYAKMYLFRIITSSISCMHDMVE